MKHIDMYAQQKGLALFTILVFLLILTVIGLSSMQTSSLQQIMAGNMQWNNIAFQTAESALNSTFNKNSWETISESGGVSTDDYSGTSNNIDYHSKTYYAGKSDLGRVLANRAWGVRKMQRAHFVLTSEGIARVATGEGTYEQLGRVELEEQDYIIVPK